MKETSLNTALFHIIPTVIVSSATFSLFFIRTTLNPSFEYSSFELFLYFFFSNLVLWTALLSKDPSKAHKNNSGYLLFYMVTLTFPFVLLFGSNFLTWDIFVFSLILLFRFAYRLRYGGIPFLSFIANAVLMYLLINQYAIAWFISVYYFLQLIESLVETKLQAVITLLNKKFGLLFLLSYYVFLVLLFRKII